MLTALKVRSELNKKLKGCKTSLSELGAKRDTPAEQSKYLIDIATRFQQNVELALTSRYWENDFFDKQPSLRLATVIVRRDDLFSETVQKYGHTYCFKSQKEEDEDPFPEVSETDDPSEIDAIPSVKIRIYEPHGDIEDLVCDNDALSLPKGDGILTWLTTVYHGSRGFEMGTFDSSLLALTWKEQSRKWDDIASGYISDVIAVAHNFVTDLIPHICPDERVRAGLTSVLMDGLVERYKTALTQVEFILQVERSGRPMTFNHYFNDNLEKW